MHTDVMLSSVDSIVLDDNVGASSVQTGVMLSSVESIV